MSCASLLLKQTRVFSAALHRLYDEPPGESPLEAVLDALELLMPLNTLSIDLVRRETGAMEHSGGRHLEPLPDTADIVPLLVKDHPGVRATLKHGPVPAQRLSDFVTQRQMRELMIYEHVMRLHRLRDQAVVLTPVPEGVLSFVLSRDRVFTAEEFFLLEMIQPHVLRVLGRCALFINLPGRERLTAREREVLYWMTRGKRDEEIGVILRCAPRTVNQHVRRILLKLNVENRTSAVAAVLYGGAIK